MPNGVRGLTPLGLGLTPLGRPNAVRPSPNAVRRLTCDGMQGKGSTTWVATAKEPEEEESNYGIESDEKKNGGAGTANGGG